MTRISKNGMGIENSDIFASPCQIDISLFKQFHAIKYFTVSEAVPVPRPPGEGGWWVSLSQSEARRPCGDQ